MLFVLVFISISLNKIYNVHKISYFIVLKLNLFEVEYYQIGNIQELLSSIIQIQNIYNFSYLQYSKKSMVRLCYFPLFLLYLAK